MKTAVELFIEQLEAQGESWENVSIGRIQISIKVEDYLKLKEQAKEIEKEQMLNAFQESRLTHPMIGFKHETFVEYYKQFKQQEQ
jgi:predicted nucleotidyltransferase